MHIEIIKQSKNEIEFQLDNVTVAEILRVYLNSSGADFAAWKREHPSKPVVMHVKSGDKTVGKVVSDAVSAVKKDCDKFLGLVKK